MNEVLLIVVVVSDGELVVGGSVMLHLNTTIYSILMASIL